MNALRTTRVFVICLALLLLTAPIWSCSSDDENPTGPMAPGVGSVAFDFDHSVDGAALVLGTAGGYPYTNAAGNAYNVENLFYYTCNFRVHMADGSSYGTDAVHYRDAGDPKTRTFTLDGIPEGTYTAVSFTFGVDARRNVDGGLLPYNLDEITWPPPLGGGYHYMEMNGNWNNGGTNTAVRVHTGRRYIAAGSGPPEADPPGPDAVPHHHFFEIYLTLATPIALSNGQAWSVPLDFNINGWFESPSFDFATWFPDNSATIMPRLPAQERLLQNGIAGSVCSAGTPTLQ